MPKAVIAILQNAEGEFLTLLRFKGRDDGFCLGFPAGMLGQGETEADAVVREVLEKTNIVCAPEIKIGQRVLSDHMELSYWRCTYISGTPRTPETKEVFGVAFRSVKDIIRLMGVDALHPAVRKELGLGFKYSSKLLFPTP